MVPIGRSSIYHRGFGHGVDHGPWPGLPLLRTRAKKVSIEHDMGVHGIMFGYHFPVVFMGIFLGV